MIKAGGQVLVCARVLLCRIDWDPVSGSVVLITDHDFFLTPDPWIGADWAIRTGQLHGLPHFHTRPVNVLVLHGPRGELV